MINAVILGKQENDVNLTLTSLVSSSPEFFEGGAKIVVANFNFSKDFIETFASLGVQFIDFAEPFRSSFSLNKCIANLDPASNILLICAGAEIQTPEFIKTLEEALVDERFAKYGIFSPAMPKPPQYAESLLSQYPVHLFTKLIKRDVWLSCGAFNLAYHTTFFMFMDFLRNAIEKTWRLGILNTATISFVRSEQSEIETDKVKADEATFNRKWGTGAYLGDYKPNRLDWNINALVLGEQEEESEIILTLPQFKEPVAAPLVESPPNESNGYVNGKMRYTLSVEHKAPEIIRKYAKNTDFEMDGELLWSLIMLARPKRIILSGAGQAAIIKITSHAAHQNRIGSQIIGIDPNPGALKLLTAFRCQHTCKNSIEYANSITQRDLATSRADMIIVDEDPHSFQLTSEWLDAWLPKMINPGGFIIFHDIIQNRPEIQVKEAVREWVKDREGWKWIEFEEVKAFYTWPQGGLGLLSAPVDLEF